MEPIVNRKADGDDLVNEWKALFGTLPQASMEDYALKYLSKLLPDEPQLLEKRRDLKDRTERMQRAELLLTLETIIACDGNMNEMARALFIHRNTAAYRIEKLEKVLGLPLRQTDNLLRLKLAFLFREMLNSRR
ncbi:PucR family transcriptional regulator [Paenibacillus sp. YIM B09110]|uniref:PucR family transcriptional regulator n=1 Tax=Paenibacillus sp. YIM B09110 TaxID=3126102 RepID=UPI00301D3896